MQSITDAIADGTLQAEIVLVLSDFSDAYILERAKKAGIPTQVLDCQGYKQKFPREEQAKVAQQLKEMGVDLICLAGFMRLVGKPLLEHFPNRILNIHPSLLPAYPGLNAWEQAVNDGAAESGCTVHYVDEGMDTGEIIAQRVVPVLSGDTAKTLHARIQEQEREVYPEVVKKLLAQ